MNLKTNYLAVIMIAFVSSLLFFSACDDKPTINNAPTCTIISPEDGAEFIQGETIIISVKVEDRDNNLEKVSFYVNNIEIGSVSSSPYNFDWNTNGEDPGYFTIKAKAIDNEQDNASNEIDILLKPINKVTDIDGNDYSVVTIGTQVWMAENLKTTKYNDGTSIGEQVEDEGLYFWYNHDQNTYDNTYGLLYNWYAVNSENLCPDGWHIPSDTEWKQLEIHLGMSQEYVDATGYRGTNEGSKLAGNTTLWTNGSLESNSEFGTSGFNALPGGYYQGYESFRLLNDFGYWWSATEEDIDYAWFRKLSYNESGIGRSNARKNYSFSIRCIKD